MPRNLRRQRARRRVTSALFCGWVLAPAGPLSCSTVTADAELSAGIDLSRYQSFAQAPRPPEEKVEHLLGYSAATARIIEREIASELVAKGYGEATGPEADMRVEFRVTGRQQAETFSTGGLYQSADVTTTHSLAGRLVIEVYDARSGQLLWRGWGTKKALGPSESGAGDAATLVVQAVMNRFPARPGEP